MTSFKPLLSSLALAGLLLASPAAAQQERIAAFFQAGHSPIVERISEQQGLGLSLAFEDFVTNGPFRLVDVEAYHDDAGDLRYDAVFRLDPAAPSPPSFLFTQVAQSSVSSTAVMQQALGRVLTDMTSWLDAGGERHYTLVFELKPGTSQGVFLGVHQSDFQALFDGQAQAPTPRRPTVLQRYYDADGEVRYDAAFTQVSGQHYTFGNLSQSQYSAEADTQIQAGRRLSWIEIHRNEDGDRRYSAAWSNTTGSSSAVVNYHDLDRAEFEQTVLDMAATGRTLIEMVVLEDVTDATRSNYGTGLAGTTGVPDLDLSDDPFLGRNLNLELGNSSGISTTGGLFLSIADAAIPFKGGTLLVTPILNPKILPLGPAGLDLPLQMPADPSYDGLELYMQLAVLDAGAPNAVALSRGLHVIMGALD